MWPRCGRFLCVIWQMPHAAGDGIVVVVPPKSPSRWGFRVRVFSYPSQTFAPQLGPVLPTSRTMCLALHRSVLQKSSSQAPNGEKLRQASKRAFRLMAPWKTRLLFRSLYKEASIIVRGRMFVGLPWGHFGLFKLGWVV